jgi:hypothetical protein
MYGDMKASDLPWRKNYKVICALLYDILTTLMGNGKAAISSFDEVTTPELKSWIESVPNCQVVSASVLFSKFSTKHKKCCDARAQFPMRLILIQIT